MFGQVVGEYEAMTSAPNVVEQNTSEGEVRKVFCGTRAD